MNRLPLDGRRIVVTRPRTRAGGLTARLRALGAEVVELATVAIEDPDSWGPLDRAIAQLPGYDWVVFASAAAVEMFFDRLTVAGRDHSALGEAKIGAVGPATATALRAHGVEPDVVPRRHTGAELAAAVGEGHGTVLLPRVTDGPRAIVDEFSARGWRVEEVPAYRNVPVEPGPATPLRRGEFDVITFTSPSTARGFARQLPASEIPDDVLVACIGPQTAEAARALGYAVGAVPGEHTVDGLVAVLLDVLDG